MHRGLREYIPDALLLLLQPLATAPQPAGEGRPRCRPPCQAHAAATAAPCRQLRFHEAAAAPE